MAQGYLRVLSFASSPTGFGSALTDSGLFDGLTKSGDTDAGVCVQAANDSKFLTSEPAAASSVRMAFYLEDNSPIPPGATINYVQLQVRHKSPTVAAINYNLFFWQAHGGVFEGNGNWTPTASLTSSYAYSDLTPQLTVNPVTLAIWNLNADLLNNSDAGGNGHALWSWDAMGAFALGETYQIDQFRLLIDYTAAGSTPTLSSINVATGPVTGDTLITLTGTNFDQCSAKEVYIGGAHAFATYVNSTTMTITTPQHFDVNETDPTKDVTLHCGASDSTLTNAFTYTPVWWDFAVPDDLDVDLDVEPFHFYGYGYPDLLDLDWLRKILGFTLANWRKLLIKFPSFRWWTPSTTPDTHGWYYSTANFGGDVYVVDSGDRPVNPRKWSQIATFATGATDMLGGSPGAAAVKSNRLYYAAADYTSSTNQPPIRILKGGSDYQLATVPKTDSGAIPYTIVSMLTANNTIYVSTLDSGSSSADWVGRVFEFDTESGRLTKIGATFPTGHVPYALEFHNGRLWCGTHKQTAAGAGRVYYFRPGIDTDWTLDLTLASGNVTSMLGFQGQLYIGTTAAGGTRGVVRQRTTAGVWSTVRTGSGGTAQDGNGYLALGEHSNTLFASYWNDDATDISKIEKSADGSSWSLSYTGASGTLRPFIGLVSDNSYLFAIGGGTARTAALVRTPDGTTWTNLTGFLPDTTETFVPVFGVMVR